MLIGSLEENGRIAVPPCLEFVFQNVWCADMMEEQKVAAMNLKKWQSFKDMQECWFGRKIVGNVPDATGLCVSERMVAVPGMQQVVDMELARVAPDCAQIYGGNCFEDIVYGRCGKKFKKTS